MKGRPLEPGGEDVTWPPVLTRWPPGAQSV